LLGSWEMTSSRETTTVFIYERMIMNWGWRPGAAMLIGFGILIPRSAEERLQRKSVHFHRPVWSQIAGPEVNKKGPSHPHNLSLPHQPSR
jgi:hypothetical protein